MKVRLSRLPEFYEKKWAAEVVLSGTEFELLGNCEEADVHLGNCASIDKVASTLSHAAVEGKIG